MIRTITVAGTPVPKARPRFSRARTGRAFAYTPKSTQEAEARIRAAWIKEYGTQPLDGALRMTVMFSMPIPKSRRDIKPGDMHTSRPDLDNLLKLVQDALNGIAYKDDSQLWSVTAHKSYDKEPETWVYISDGKPE